MEKRFSEMTEEELSRELLKFKEGAMKKHQAGFFSEAAVYEQKFYLAKAYLTDPTQFKPGQSYRVIGYDEIFRISYINGRMAWGTFPPSTDETAFPISRLEKLS